MKASDPWSVRKAAIWAVAFAAKGVLGDDILTTTGFTNCENDSGITVTNVNINYDNTDKTLNFNVAGISTKEQNVTAILTVTALGQNVYTNQFSPCEPETFVSQLCPVPLGQFAADGSQSVPAQLASQIPAIAFQIPDIAAEAKLELRSLDDGSAIGCIQSQVTNGKTVDHPGVSYAAAGIAAGALALSAASAISGAVSGAAAHGASAGVGTMSPSFGEVFGVFQGFALNGMMSVQMPPVYRRFSKNFAFSTGLIPWRDMQIGIDNFRSSTGGNLTKDSVEILQRTMLVFPDGSTSTTNSSNLFKRSFDDFAYLSPREVNVSLNSTVSGLSQTAALIRTKVEGIKGVVNTLAVPEANTFMTVLEIVAIVIGAIIVSILLVKVILEFWSQFGQLPEGLEYFRKHYWGTMARTITSLILLLYGVWVLYCVFQFTHGDSWAAQALAALTLALFTGVLAFFSWKIFSVARRLQQTEGDAASLYEDKRYWQKYSLFYESYKKGYWWLFIPSLIYLFAKSTVIAATDGHGMVQSIASLTVEALFLILLAWSRPYERKSGNIINISIQTVRVLSVIVILVFVEEFGVAQTTQTVAGIALIAVQSGLSVVLAGLIFWNAMISLFKKNPHEKRMEMEKSHHRDTLTSLHPRNSLLNLDKIRSRDSDAFSLTDMGNASKGRNHHGQHGHGSRRDSSERYLSMAPERPSSVLDSLPSPSHPPAYFSEPYQHPDSFGAHIIPADREPTVPTVGEYGSSRPYQGRYGPGSSGRSSNKAPHPSAF